jgi:hypothetical protein
LYLGFAGEPKRQLNQNIGAFSAELSGSANEHLTQAFFTQATVMYVLDHIFLALSLS